MKTLPKLAMVGGLLLLACGPASRAHGQIGNFGAPLGQPAYSAYSAPYGQMGQPTPNQYAAPYGQMGQPSTNGQVLPGYTSNFARPGHPQPVYGQPIYAQSYFGIPNYAQPASVPSHHYASGYSMSARAYSPALAPLGYIPNYARPTFRTSPGVIINGRSTMIPR